MKPNKFFLQYTQQNHSACIKTSRLCKKMHHVTVPKQRGELNHHQRKILLDPVAINQSRSLIFKISGDSEVDEEGAAELSSPHSIFQPFNASTETPLKGNFKHEHRQQPTSDFDSSLALTILVLLTALFFMGFFSLYLRRFSDDETSNSRRRRPTSVPASSSVTSVLDNQKGKGLDPSTVRSLPMVCYGEDVQQVIFSDCPICLTEFEQAEIVKIIPHCRHVFHPKCIDTWLVSHVSCPFCRSTKFCKDGDGDGEIRLDVKREQDNNGVGESSDRSTVEDEDTSREVGSMKRICSWTRLGDGDRVVLQRSMSF